MNKKTRAKVLAVLKRARAKIVQGWCRGCYAVDSHGCSVLPQGSAACRWCAVGAIQAAANGDDDMAWVAQAAVADCLSTGDMSITRFNDTQVTSEPVLDLFDRAIERLESE